MKYWNKTKKYRELHWTTVAIAPGSWDEMKLWCQRHPSKYRFYSGSHERYAWYFEDPEDALVFKLVWPNIPIR